MVCGSGGALQPAGADHGLPVAVINCLLVHRADACGSDAKARSGGAGGVVRAAGGRGGPREPVEPRIRWRVVRAYCGLIRAGAGSCRLAASFWLASHEDGSLVLRAVSERAGSDHVAFAGGCLCGPCAGRRDLSL